MMDDERHPLDDALGDIHEIAIKLSCLGYTAEAVRLAGAYERIQQYLINTEVEINPYH